MKCNAMVVWLLGAGCWTAGLAAGMDATPAGAAEGELLIWRDPEFRQAFLGTYGMRSEVEPRVTVIEKEDLDRVAKLMSGTNGLDKARAFLEKNTKPVSSAVFDFTLANVYQQLDKLPLAAEWYQKAIKKYPSFQRAHKNLGLVHVRTGAYEKAVDPLTKAIELGATDGLTFGLLGYSYAMTEQYASAEGAFRQAMMLQPQAMDWKVGLTRCLFKMRKYEEAAALCEELIRRNPEKVDYWMLQANAFMGMKQPLRAAQNYELLDLTGQAASSVLNTLGDVYANEGLMDQAGDAYRRALAKDPQGDPARYLRDGEVLAARGAHAEARRLLAALREIMGQRIQGDEQKRLLKLDARLALAAGAGAEQAKILEDIVRLDPLDGEALILLGQHHAAAGRVEKGIFYFERAAGLPKYEAVAKLRHAQCLVKGAKYQEAVPLLKRAQELNPREDVQRYLEQVERVARAKN